MVILAAVVSATELQILSELPGSQSKKGNTACHMFSIFYSGSLQNTYLLLELSLEQ